MKRRPNAPKITRFVTNGVIVCAGRRIPRGKILAYASAMVPPNPGELYMVTSATVCKKHPKRVHLLLKAQPLPEQLRSA